jgi:hypothetical protein
MYCLYLNYRFKKNSFLEFGEQLVQYIRLVRCQHTKQLSLGL